MMKQLALYTTLFSASAAAGAYRGYHAAHGMPTPAGLDLALIAAPVASGVLAGMLGPDTLREARGRTSYGIAELATNLFGAFEMGMHGAFGAIGSAVAEGVGYAGGYVAGKF